MVNSGTEATSASPETVVLTIDYGNGAQKRFADIHCPQRMDVLEVLRAAGSINPGLVFEFNELGSDRSGRQRGIIASIDGEKADEPNQKWLIRISGRFEGDEISVTTVGALSPANPEVNAGDVVELRRMAGE